MGHASVGRPKLLARLRVYRLLQPTRGCDLRSIGTFSALFLSAACAGGLAVLFLPLPGEVAASPQDGLPPGGCHANAQRHFVPEWGREAPHFHRVPDCAPIPILTWQRPAGRPQG